MDGEPVIPVLIYFTFFPDGMVLISLMLFYKKRRKEHISHFGMCEIQTSVGPDQISLVAADGADHLDERHKHLISRYLLPCWPVWLFQFANCHV
jgi:hypothetical protein